MSMLIIDVNAKNLFIIAMAINAFETFFLDA